MPLGTLHDVLSKKYYFLEVWLTTGTIHWFWGGPCYICQDGTFLKGRHDDGYLMCCTLEQKVFGNTPG